MALDAAKLARMSDHNNHLAPHIWCYITTSDDCSTVAAADYFLHTKGLTYRDTFELSVGDLVWTYCSDGGQFLEIASATEATVTTAVVDTD